MNYRELGRTGWKVSEISFGTWAIGGAWGDVDDHESLAALHRAVDLGVNFFDAHAVIAHLALLYEVIQRFEQLRVVINLGRRTM